MQQYILLEVMMVSLLEDPWNQRSIRSEWIADLNSGGPFHVGKKN
jgi:hypothetical protein